MSDLIERDKAIEKLKENVVEMGGDDFSEMGVHIDDIESVINSIPSARPKGEWIDWLGKGNEWECSVCKCSVESHGSIAYNYCPMCGASMVKERASDDGVYTTQSADIVPISTSLLDISDE